MRSLQEIHGGPEDAAASMTAPYGRRLCEVAKNEATGGYQVFSLLDREGPEPVPGQFYMLAAEEHWDQRGGRPFLPRAISVAETGPAAADGVRLDFLIEGVGPGTERLAELVAGEGVWVNGPLGNAFAEPREVNPGAAGAILVGGGIGIAPLALLRRRFSERGVPLRVLLGFRDRGHSAAWTSSAAPVGDLCPEVRLASEDGHAGHRGYVTDLLATMLAGDDADIAVVYSCGPPAMLEAVRAALRRARRPLRAGAGVADGLRLRRLLRLRGAEARWRLPAALRRRAGAARATAIAEVPAHA